jgi:hypothetical protein
MQCSFLAPLGVANRPSRSLQLESSSPSTSTAGSEEFSAGLSKEYEGTNFASLLPNPDPLFRVQVEDNACWMHQVPNCDLTELSGLPPLEILEMLPRYQQGAVLSTCFSSGVRYRDENGHAENDENEDFTPVRDLIERAPGTTSSEKELLLHFEEFTSKNLALSTTIWGTHVLRRALQVCV